MYGSDELSGGLGSDSFDPLELVAAGSSNGGDRANPGGLDWTEPEPSLGCRLQRIEWHPRELFVNDSLKLRLIGGFLRRLRPRLRLTEQRHDPGPEALDPERSMLLGAGRTRSGVSACLWGGVGLVTWDSVKCGCQVCHAVW